MAEYFVDNGVVGGNGLSAASAFNSVLSAGPLLAAGDRVWIRRTHSQVLTASQRIGPHSLTAIAGFARRTWVIGWPGPNDPYYEERPVSARSLWDADNPATFVYSVYGLSMPLFVGSSATAGTGMLLAPNCHYANLAFSNSGANTIQGPWADAGGIAADITAADNIAFFHQGGAMARFGSALNNVQLGRVILVVSGSNTAGAINPDWSGCQELVVHSSCVWSGGLLQAAGETWYGLLNFQSASIDALMRASGSALTSNGGEYLGLYIRKVAGIKPYSGFFGGDPGNTGYGACNIDDWFGEGPALLGGPRQTNFFLAASAEAMYNDRRAYRYFTSSVAGARYGANCRRWPLIGKDIEITSGSLRTVRFPIYVDSTAVFSPAEGSMYAKLHAPGKNTAYAVQSTVLTGTPAEWSGSLISGGTAYMFEAQFTPTETGRALVTLHVDNIVQASSGQGRQMYALFGEPEVV